MHVLPALLPVPKGRPVPRGRGEGEGTWGQGCPWEPTSSGVGTTVSQAGPCWEMAPCRAGLAPSPGCQPPSCPRSEQSLPWALPQTPSVLGGLARGGTRGLVALGGSLSSRKGLGVPTAQCHGWVLLGRQARCCARSWVLVLRAPSSRERGWECAAVGSELLWARGAFLPLLSLPHAWHISHLPPWSIFPLGNLAPSLKSAACRPAIPQITHPSLPIPVYPDYPSQRRLNPS